jgi:hypothetical protein
MEITGIAMRLIAGHCIDISKIVCGLIFDRDRPAPEKQLEDKTKLKQWS